VLLTYRPVRAGRAPPGSARGAYQATSTLRTHQAAREGQHPGLPQVRTSPTSAVLTRLMSSYVL